MKKRVLLVTICGILCGYASNGFAVSAITWGPGSSLGSGCFSWQCTNPEQWYMDTASPTGRNCANWGAYTAMCVHMTGRVTGVASCMLCDPGYELAEGTASISACAATESGYEESYDELGDKIPDDRSSISSYKYTYCTKNCNSTTCASTAWVAKGTGYQTRTYRSCSQQGTNGTCSGSTQYQCAPDYYGSSTNGTSGCTQCPTWTGVYTDSAKTTLARGTSAAGATAITGCYVVPGTYYDATGTFKITSNCNYSN